MLFMEAVNYHEGRLRPIRLIVVHTTEAPEVKGSARGTAKYFAGQPKGGARSSSAHFCIDAAEVVQCVRVEDTAWAAPGANADGIQLEHAGVAAQTGQQWDDDYSDGVLARSAALAATLARAYKIPIRHLTDKELADGRPGFVGHDQVSRVYRKSDHTDPGTHFPWGRYMQLVAAGGGSTPQEETMTAVDLTQAALDALSAEMWGPQSSYVTRLPEDVARDPQLAAKYAEGRLSDGSPVISPITTLRWAMEAARSAANEARAAREELAALRADVAKLLQAGGHSNVPVDHAAVARAVAAELATRLAAARA